MVRVWVNGTFDVLTIAHIRMLKYARSLGDELIVAIDTDSRVKEKKGIDRPFNVCSIRKEFIKSLRCVSQVNHFGTDNQLENLLELYAPDIMVIGSDWKGKTIIGAKFCKQIIYFERIEGFSTTQILNYKKK
jgi:D-glycero-beta-D-manno-heptose 1-phosphate adenylyltransferase